MQRRSLAHCAVARARAQTPVTNPNLYKPQKHVSHGPCVTSQKLQNVQNVWRCGDLLPPDAFQRWTLAKAATGKCLTCRVGQGKGLRGPNRDCWTPFRDCKEPWSAAGRSVRRPSAVPNTCRSLLSPSYFVVCEFCSMAKQLFLALVLLGSCPFSEQHPMRFRCSLPCWLGVSMSHLPVNSVQYVFHLPLVWLRL